MGKRKLIFWFLGFMTLYFITRYLRTEYPGLPSFFKYQFTDLLFVPTMCIFALMVVRWLKRDQTITISIGLVALQVILVSYYFEVYLPNYKSHIHPYTFDVWDMVMYVLGGFFFLLLQRKFF